MNYKFVSMFYDILHIIKMPMENHRHLLLNKKRILNYASALATTETTLLS